VLGIGDWAAVIRGLEPSVVWRIALGITGAATYVGSVLLVAREFRGAGVSRAEAKRLIVPAYISGGLLLVAASAMNPIDPALILTSGASAGFGAPAGLLAVPALSGPGDASLPRSTPWLVAGLIAAIFFIFVVGRGIPL